MRTSLSLILIVIPAVYFFFYEYEDLRMGDRILSSIFQSVTTRTAGFNTTDFAAFTDSGKLLSIILMLVGGSPGSTAGGMKTTTFAILILNAHGFLENTGTFPVIRGDGTTWRKLPKCRK